MQYLQSLLICLLISTFTFAQNQNTINGRKAFTLSLAVDTGQYYKADIDAGPYIKGPNILQLYPGEKVFVEVEQEGGVVKTLRCVKKNKHPDKTMEINFYQEAKGGKHEQMMLKIVNPFNKELSYKADIFIMKTNAWEDSHVLPVMPKLVSFETWPYIIVSVALSDWRLTSAH